LLRNRFFFIIITLFILISNSYTQIISNKVISIENIGDTLIAVLDSGICLYTYDRKKDSLIFFKSTKFDYPINENSLVKIVDNNIFVSFTDPNGYISFYRLYDRDLNIIEEKNIAVSYVYLYDFEKIENIPIFILYPKGVYYYEKNFVKSIYIDSTDNIKAFSFIKFNDTLLYLSSLNGLYVTKSPLIFKKTSWDTNRIILYYDIFDTNFIYYVYDIQNSNQNGIFINSLSLNSEKEIKKTTSEVIFLSLYDSIFTFFTGDSLYWGSFNPSNLYISNIDIDQIKDYKINAIKNIDSLLVIGTNKGIFYKKINDTLYKEIYIEKSVLYDLKQVYAFPTVITTKTPKAFFAYRLSKDDYVTIEIRTFSGRKIKTIIKNKLRYASNTKSTNYDEDWWDGTDSNGNIVPPGIYIFVIKTKSGLINYGKIVVLRKKE